MTEQDGCSLESSQSIMFNSIISDKGDAGHIDEYKVRQVLHYKL